MTQIKLFHGLENDLPALERQINQWLGANPVKVLQMTSNIAPQSESGSSRGGLTGTGGASDVLVGVLYELTRP